MSTIDFMKLDNKKWANILLTIAVLNIIRLIAVFFQTKHMLISPLIPTDTIVQVSIPYLFNALISSRALAVALVFYFYSKYIVTIVICGITLFLPVTLYYTLFSN
jgi:hypothetical protein